MMRKKFYLKPKAGNRPRLFLFLHKGRTMRCGIFLSLHIYVHLCQSHTLPPEWGGMRGHLFLLLLRICFRFYFCILHSM